jgi:hypothetical protein
MEDEGRSAVGYGVSPVATVTIDDIEKPMTAINPPFKWSSRE